MIGERRIFRGWEGNRSLPNKGSARHLPGGNEHNIKTVYEFGSYLTGKAVCFHSKNQTVYFLIVDFILKLPASNPYYLSIFDQNTSDSVLFYKPAIANFLRPS
jgi:hypothetical protein